MAAHQATTQGWYDTPCHPVIGVALFIVGFVAIIIGALFAASLVLR